MRAHPVIIEAVLFDLDDTLYPQEQWLRGAWKAVVAAAPDGVPRPCLHRALLEVAALGTDRGGIIDRALTAVGCAWVDPSPLVQAFRGHAPARLTPYPGARRALRSIATSMPVGLVTDGEPSVQRAKLDALRLAARFDAVVLSDLLGRERRKPHPAPFLAAARALGIPPGACVYVGDRPDKDLAGARAAGLAGAVRVRTGEHAHVPDGPGWLAVVSSAEEAVAWIREGLGVRPCAGSGSVARARPVSGARRERVEP